MIDTTREEIFGVPAKWTEGFIDAHPWVVVGVVAVLVLVAGFYLWRRLRR